MRMTWTRLLTGAAVLGSALTLLRRPSLATWATQRPPSPPEGYRGLTARFFGTSTILFSDGETSILIDGFFSRPGAMRVLFGRIRPEPSRIDEALKGVSSVAAVFVAHSHYDHALDSATVARRYGARLVGSESTANIARGEGFPNDHIDILRERVPMKVGSFTVTAYRTPHSHPQRFPGTIDRPLPLPARVSEYLEGGNYSFLVEHGQASVLVVTSGNFTPGMFRGVRADTVFLSIGRVGAEDESFAARYWANTVVATGARLVIPIHWDDFTLPLDEPLQPNRRVADNAANAMRMIAALAGRDVEVRLPVAFEEIDVRGVER